MLTVNVAVIKQLRTRQKLSQAELARRAGISRQALIKIEAGSYDPSLKVFNKLIEALGYKLIIAVEA